MDKHYYKSTDSRTGIPEGTIVELSMDELNQIPFNSTLVRIVPEDHLEAEAFKQSHEKELAREQLRLELLNKGLSMTRTKKIVDKYADKTTLTANAESAGIDELTDKWVRLEYAQDNSAPKRARRKE